MRHFTGLAWQFMKRSFIFVSFQFLLLLFVFAFATVAQTPTPTPVDDPGATKVFEVRLPVTVTQNKKTLISGLSKNDFLIFEDGVQQEVTFFSDEKTNPAVYVGVLWNNWPSGAGKIKF